MKFLLIGLAVVATAYAALPTGEYLPPSDEYSSASPFELQDLSEPAAVLAEDGYRYKTVKKLRHRARRDVNELANNEYLPPVETEVAAPVEAEPAAELADDGYRYKTVRRLKYRRRRDVSEIPTGEYLPPLDAGAYEFPTEVAAEPAGFLADDGYRYKTVKKLRLRHRRDVSELNSEYLPPTADVSFPSNFNFAANYPEEASGVLADDGYRYKAVKKLRRHRHRRDVNELSTNEYLPPAEEGPVAEAVAPVEAEQGTELAQDGYRYKTVRRLKYRRRRDVSELPTGEYLPPLEAGAYEFPTEVAAESAGFLADDGYRYKTVKKLRHRHRRDVSELNAEYLPPTAEASFPSSFDFAAAYPEEGGVLAADGYRYKAIKKLRHRNRRQAIDLPVSNEYLPPTGVEATLPVETAFVDAAPAAELAEDGYRYKTVRRLKYRQRRDVSELPTGEYLPPLGEVAAPVDFGQQFAEPLPAHLLSADGYRYKTARKYKVRRH